MLHDEARRLMLQAWNKTHNAKGVAACFSVDTSTVYCLVAQVKKTGDYHTHTHQRGRKAALSQEQRTQIAELMNQHNDITLMEIIEQLHLSVSDETVRRALRVMGYTFVRLVSAQTPFHATKGADASPYGAKNAGFVATQTTTDNPRSGMTE